MPASSSEPSTEAVDATESESTFSGFPPGLTDKYQVLEEWPARGAEADIFLVSDASGAEYVAKIYRRGIAASTERLLEYLERLGGFAAQLIDHGRSNDRDFEIFEYMEAGSLADLISREGPGFEPKRVREIFVSLLAAVERLHGADVVHCDLKPDNILVRRTRPVELVLTDFNLSQEMRDASRLFFSASGRTLAYAPPEAGSDEVSRAYDFWAVGIMLVEMLTGRRVFPNMDDRAILSFLIQGDLKELVDGVDEPWWILCRGLLWRDSTERWGASEARRWLDGDESLALPIETESPGGELSGPEWAPDVRSLPELSVWLAENWNEGARRLRRREVRSWVQNTVKDEPSVKILDDAERQFGRDVDRRLFMVIYRFNPELYPIFAEHPIDERGLASLRTDTSTLSGDKRIKFVARLFNETILSFYDDLVDRTELGPIEEKWRALVTEYRELSERLIASGAPDRDVRNQSDQPLPDLLMGSLSNSDKTIKEYRSAVRKAVPRDAFDCEWFQELGRPSRATWAELIRMIELGEIAATEAREIKKQRAIERRARRKQTLTNIYLGYFGGLIGAVFTAAFAWLALTIVAGLWAKFGTPPSNLQQVVVAGMAAGGLIGLIRGARNGVRHPATTRARIRGIFILSVVGFVAWWAGVVPWFQDYFEGIGADFQIVNATPATSLDWSAETPIGPTAAFEEGQSNFAYSLNFRGATPGKTDIKIYLAQISPTRSTQSLKTCSHRPGRASGWFGCELSGTTLSPGTYIWLLNYKTPFRDTKGHRTTFSIKKAPDPLVRAIQNELRRLGYRVGEVDGVYGPKTKSAIQQFQRRNRMSRDGKATRELLRLLQRQ